MKAIFLVLALLAGPLLADGIPMSDDFRFTSKKGTCHTLKLTREQMTELDGKRNENGSLYAEMLLTPEQKAFLLKMTDLRVNALMVFEGKWMDCSCCAHNIASRFLPDRVEVSTNYLEDIAVTKRREERLKAIDAEQARKRAAEKALEQNNGG